MSIFPKDEIEYPAPRTGRNDLLRPSSRYHGHPRARPGEHQEVPRHCAFRACRPRRGRSRLHKAVAATGIEVRGSAQAIDKPEPVIRIHPQRIVAWGIGAGGLGRNSRSVG